MYLPSSFHFEYTGTIRSFRQSAANKTGGELHLLWSQRGVWILGENILDGGDWRRHTLLAFHAVTVHTLLVLCY